MIKSYENENNTLSKSEKILIYIGLIFSGAYVFILSIISLSQATLTYLRLIIIVSGAFVALSAMISINKANSRLHDIIIGFGIVMVVAGASLLRDIFFIVVPLSILSIILVIYSKAHKKDNALNRTALLGVIATGIICLVFILDFWMFLIT